MGEPTRADDARPPTGALRIDAEERVASVDAAFCRMFECAEGDVVGKSLEDLLSRRDRRSTQQFYQGLIRHREGVFDALVSISVAGRDHYVRLRMLRTPGGWAASVEQALSSGSLLYRMLEAQERWAAVFQTSDEGIAVLDGEGRMLELNARFHELMAFRSKHGIALSEGALVGRAISDPELLGDALDRPADGPGLSRTVVRGERVVELRTGEITLPVRGVTGRWVVARDVTQRREIEELKIRQAQAHYAGMAEVATNVLHNLGNVCTSVIFAAESMLRTAERSNVSGLARANELLASNLDRLGHFFASDPKAEPLARYYLKLGDALTDEVEKILEGGRDLLRKSHLMKDAIAAQQAYARGSDFVEPVDLGRTIDDVLQLQKTSLDRLGVKVVRRIPEGSVLRAQRSKLTHVLINLVKNAREAMEDTPADKRVITLELVDGEGTMRLDVSDEGVGIKPENLPKIFTHGFTTKPKGHGFGLHFCATAMGEMGGKLAAQSAGPGKGTTITLLLPKGEKNPA